MYLPLGEFPEKLKVGRAGARVLVGVLCLALAVGVFGGTLSAYAACSNPSPLPSGYAAPCPVFSVSPAAVPQTGTLSLTASPLPGTDYVYTTAYYAKGSTWLPVTLVGNNAAPSYSSGPATGSLPASILSTLTPGTNYIVLWDWLWDATAGCYKGPGLNQCNTGIWRLQVFGLTVNSALFAMGDRVQETANVNVFATPSLSGTVLGPQLIGSVGTIVSGPVTADGLVWWNINYDSGVDGWSKEIYLQKVGSPTPAPTPIVGGCAGPFTLQKQQPVTCVPYQNNPASITSKRLPANIMSHLWRNSDAIAKCALTDCGAGASSVWGFTQWALPGANDRQQAPYYGQATDPWYKLSNCTDGNSRFLNGLTFHAPNGAKWSQSGDDEAIAIWDQTNQMVVHMSATGGGHALPASSCSGTGSSSCAVGTNSPNGYCYAEKFDQERDWGWTNLQAPFGGGHSTGIPGFSAFGGIVRFQEMIQGQINHAVGLLDDCHNTTTPYVFPSNGANGVTGLLCSSAGAGTNSPDRPSAGNLIFLDYTDAQINGMSLPSWQKTLITVFSHYGGYIGVTAGGPQSVTGQSVVGLGSNNVESGEPYVFMNVSDPFFTWLAPQSGVTIAVSSTGSNRYQVHMFAGLPLLTGREEQIPAGVHVRSLPDVM